MARIYHIKKYQGRRTCQHIDPDGTPSTCNVAKKDHDGLDHPYYGGTLQCSACYLPIEVGHAYKWTMPRPHRATKGIKKTRHEECRTWRPSEMASSPYKSGVLAAEEASEDAVLAIDCPETAEAATDALEELRAIAESFADDVVETAEMLRESAVNIEDGFGHPTYQSEELDARAEELESWADQIRDPGFDEFDPEDSVDLYDDDEGDIDEDDIVDAIADAASDWWTDQIELLSDAAASNPEA